MNVCWKQLHDPLERNDKCSLKRRVVLSEGKEVGERPSPSKRQRFEKQQRRVHFQEDLVSAVVVSKEDAKEIQPEHIWFSADECAETCKELRALVQEARRLGGFHPDPELVRGLESMLSVKAAKERKARMRNTIKAVLKEQARQSTLKVHDPLRLGQHAASASQSSRDRAWMRGSLDARAAYPFGVSSSYYQSLRNVAA